jgi:hypothetical protein
MPVILALALLFSLVSTTTAAEVSAPVAITQLDLAKRLIDTFGWSEGLPENPVDKDYLAILEGNRTFRIEAEDAFDRQSDAVSVRDTPLFGTFSGGGWLSGTSTQTAVHFRVFMPLSGNYTLKASARGNEQLWSIAGRAFKVSFGDQLQERNVGKVFIPSGFIEFNTLIPPEAGIDYILLTAPAYTAIGPSAGWDFKSPLTAAALAETAASILGNEALLPDDTTFAKITIEASTATLSAGAQITEVQVYGKPVATKWVRAAQVPATVTIPVAIDKTGVYRLRVRCMGGEVTGGFAAAKVTLPARPFLDWIDFGTFRLQKGTRTLELQLPPSAGADLVEISRKVSTSAEYLAINKITGKEDAPVSQEKLDLVMKSLQEQFKERK